MSDKPVVVPFSHHPSGNRYSQEMVDKVYQVWAFMGKRSPTKTLRLLEDETWREAVGLVWDEDLPNRSTIEYWSKEYRWLERFHNDIEESGGALIYQAKAELLIGLNEAAGLLRDTITGTNERRQDQLKAAEILLSYGIGRDSGAHVTAKPRSESDIDPDELMDKSTEDLLELARRTSERFRRAG